MVQMGFTPEMDRTRVYLQAAWNHPFQDYQGCLVGTIGLPLLSHQPKRTVPGG